MQSAKLTITTEQDLESVVDLATSLHDHEVKSFDWLALGSLGSFVTILDLLSLRLSSKIYDAARSHLPLDLELESFDGLECRLYLELLCLVELDGRALSLSLFASFSVTHLLRQGRESVILLLKVIQAIHHVFTTESHAVSLQLADGLHVQVLLQLDLLHELSIVCQRLLAQVLLAVAGALGGAKTHVLQVAELQGSHRLSAHVLVARAGFDRVSATHATPCLAHHHLLLGTLGSFSLSLLCFLKFDFHFSHFFLVLLDNVLSLLKLVLHGADFLGQVVALDLKSRHLVSLGLGLLELALERLRDEDGLILVLLHRGHLLELLLLLLHQVRVLVLQGAHVFELRLDLLGNDAPRTASLEIRAVKVVEVDLVGAILGFNLLSELLELEVVVEGDDIALNCLKHTAPGLLASLLDLLGGALPEHLDGVELLAEALIDIGSIFVDELLAAFGVVDVVELQDNVEQAPVDKAYFLNHLSALKLGCV